LWEPLPEGRSGGSCVVLTTEPNYLVSSIHDRMPVILEPGSYDLWLDPDVSEPAAVRGLLRAYSDDAMEAAPVGPTVNNAHSEGPDCLLPPVEEPMLPGLFE
jgi:putative SOS response-associated peptidase YedK